MNEHPRAQLLEHLLAHRILLLDGAMGTMIQSYKLDEADYRGSRFAAGAKFCGRCGNTSFDVITSPGASR